jgi:hypothetical protein
LHPPGVGGSIEHEVARLGSLEACLRRLRRKGRPDVAKYEAYCVKCRQKREFEGTETTLKNGRKAANGTCPVCGTNVMRILGKAG